MLISECYRCPSETRSFSAEFKSAQLGLEQNYAVVDVDRVMDVGLSTMMRWVKQLGDEQQAKTPNKPENRYWKNSKTVDSFSWPLQTG